MSSTSDPRVLFAAERTLMAWNRTAIALIAFGFLVERSGLILQFLTSEASSPYTLWFGAAFIVLGAICAAVSAKQYLRILTDINPNDIPAGYNAHWGAIVNLVVAALGLCLSAALYFTH